MMHAAVLVNLLSILSCLNKQVSKPVWVPTDLLVYPTLAKTFQLMMHAAALVNLLSILSCLNKNRAQLGYQYIPLMFNGSS